jgi:excisionase family DNA binding protein
VSPPAAPYGGSRAGSTYSANGGGVVLALPPDAVEAIVEQVTARVLERLADQGNGGPGWLHGAQAVADYTGLPCSTVFKLVAREELPCRRVGSRLLFERAALDQWLREDA